MSPRKRKAATLLPGLTGRKKKVNAAADMSPLGRAVAVVKDESSDEKGPGPVLTLYGCPPHVAPMWDRIAARDEVAKGDGLTACYVTGISNLSATQAYRRWAKLREDIADAEAAMGDDDEGLSLDAVTDLYKFVGNPKRPGMSISPRSPSAGDPEPLAFRSTAVHRSRLGERAELLGMGISTLGIVLVGCGMARLAPAALHGMARQAMLADFADLVELIDKRHQKLARLFRFYKGGGDG